MSPSSKINGFRGTFELLRTNEMELKDAVLKEGIVCDVIVAFG